MTLQNNFKRSKDPNEQLCDNSGSGDPCKDCLISVINSKIKKSYSRMWSPMGMETIGACYIINEAVTRGLVCVIDDEAYEVEQ